MTSLRRLLGRWGGGAIPAPATPGRQRLARYVRIGVACLAAVVGLLGVLRLPAFIEPIIEPFELRILDWHTVVRGPLPPPPSITVVAIDERSLDRIGRWPWPRTRTAELITRLADSRLARSSPRGGLPAVDERRGRPDRILRDAVRRRGGGGPARRGGRRRAG